MLHRVGLTHLPCWKKITDMTIVWEWVKIELRTLAGKEESYRVSEQALWFLFDPHHIFLWPVNKTDWLWQDELLLHCPCLPIDLMLLSPEWFIVSTHTEHSTRLWRGSWRTGCLRFYEITFSISPELDPASPSQKRELNLKSASLVE